jgi:hypothetical protein
MRWLAFGKPKQCSDGYKFNFYENDEGDFFLVVWRKPRFRRVVPLGRHISLGIVDKLVKAGLPRDIAALIDQETQFFLAQWL